MKADIIMPLTSVVFCSILNLFLNELCDFLKFLDTFQLSLCYNDQYVKTYFVSNESAILNKSFERMIQ